jgi:hypothetical protein
MNKAEEIYKQEFSRYGSGPGALLARANHRLTDMGEDTLRQMDEAFDLCKESIAFADTEVGDDVMVREFKANIRTFQEAFKDVRNGLNTALSVSGNISSSLGEDDAKMIR